MGVAGCTKNTGNYPDFINPSESETVETAEKYTINVVSAGGLKLNNIKVTAYNSNGAKIKSGWSSNGVINLGIALGEYTLEVDESTLPKGYYLEEGVTYKTNPEKRDPVTITINSKIISQAATSDTVYALGDIVNDFVLEDYRTYDESYTGTRSYRVSDLLKTKKAVVLNFWYPDCTNCTIEFPYLQAAYEEQSDVEVLGVCTSGYTKQEIAGYKTQNSSRFNLTFPLGLDTSNLVSKYSITAAPTTIVIDRYGMYAFREVGAQPSKSFWSSLFRKYASDDYVQEVTQGEDNGGSSSIDQEKPDVSMPSSDLMAAAASADGLKAVYREDLEDAYAWPWTVGTDSEMGSVITVTNTGKNNSYATLYVDVELEKDDVLAFDYKVSSERYDYLYVFLDGQIMNSNGWSGETGWQTEEIYVADRDRTVELAFIYQKDAEESEGSDTAMITNIRTYNVSNTATALDVMRPCATGDVSSNKYEVYKTVVLGDDGFYHIDSANGPLLYISINNITPWSELHTKDNHFEYDGSSYYASLYLMTYYMYANDTEDAYGNKVFDVYMDNKDFGSVVKDYYHLLGMLDGPYYLMPVSAQLKDWADSFLKEYAAANVNETYHSQQWLEFCFYYDHYGADHEEGDSCLMNTDLTKGYSMFNTFEIAFDGIPDDGDKMTVEGVEVNVEYPLSKPNSVFFTFTAPKDGVYQIRDYPLLKADGETGVIRDVGVANVGLTISSPNGDGLNSTFISFSNGVRDFDAITGTVSYKNFNDYIALKEGETVYLQLTIDEQTTGDLLFNITYHDVVNKLFDCSSYGGSWTYVEIDGNMEYVYLAEDVKLADDGCYYIKGEDGEADYNKPVYINMCYDSNIVNGYDNYLSLEEIINKGRFEGEENTKMLSYLEQSKQNEGEFYGLVPATQEIVEILSRYVKGYDSDGGGDGRGWLAFGAYMEYIVCA